MEEETLKQLKGKLAQGQVCECGEYILPEWIRVMPNGKSAILASYTCQVCGRERTLSVSLKRKSGSSAPSVLALPTSLVTSDDVLDIKKELSEIKLTEIKKLDRKSRQVKPQILKPFRSTSKF